MNLETDENCYFGMDGWMDHGWVEGRKKRRKEGLFFLFEALKAHLSMLLPCFVFLTIFLYPVK